MSQGHPTTTDSEELLKIEQELQIARRIQAGFLPAALPAPEGWELVAAFDPAREVAGDFYDGFMLSQNRRVGFVIADVVDKGVPAALFMALVRSLMRAFAQQHYSLSWTSILDAPTTGRWGQGGDNARRQMPSTGTIALEKAVTLTNEYIMENHIDLNMFATLFFGVFDPGTGQVSYINAGHNPPYIVSAEGELKAELKPTGPAVGMFAGIEYEIAYAEIEPGDILMAYTDGVTEARSVTGEFFTPTRLQKLLEQPALSAEEVVTRLSAALRTFMEGAPQFDDITMMVVRRKPTPTS